MNELKGVLAWDLGFCKLYENWSRKYNTNQTIYLCWLFPASPSSPWPAERMGKFPPCESDFVEKGFSWSGCRRDPPLTHPFHPPNSSKPVKKAFNISHITLGCLNGPAQETICQRPLIYPLINTFPISTLMPTGGFVYAIRDCGIPVHCKLSATSWGRSS